MRTYEELNGNLISLAKLGLFDVIAHGCNCFCAMGAGIAKDIKREFDGAYIVDSQTKKGDYNKLGNYTKAYQHGVWIYNLYTQYEYGREKIQIDYDALTLCLRKLNRECAGKTIGLPLIGCGLAGGNWEKVKQIIKNELYDMDIKIIFFKK